jgi:hypothetical protein
LFRLFGLGARVKALFRFYFKKIENLGIIVPRQKFRSNKVVYILD